MVQVVAEISDEVKNQNLRNAMKNIAEELSPNYMGKLAVKLYNWSCDLGGYSYFYIEEKTPSPILGVIPFSKKKSILAIDSPSCYSNELKVYLRNPNDEAVVLKHLQKYANDNGFSQIALQKRPSQDSLDTRNAIGLRPAN